ncbi:hypothetical protein ACFX1R_016582 [Malus domestica]
MCQLISFSFTDYFGPRMSWLDRARGHIKHLTSIWSEFDKFCDKLIAKHKEAEKEGKPRKKDFVDILLQVRKDGNDFELKSDHLKLLLLDMFVGGSDTSWTAMIWLMTELGKNQSSVQRDPKVWDKPDEFYPGRFEEKSVGFVGQEFELIPFGAGRRVCPGLGFGVASEHVFSNLLYWFDMKLPSGDKALAKTMDTNEVYRLSVHKKAPLNLIPIPYNP